VIKIAQKITWQEPEEANTIQVEISRATTIYGAYSVIDTINATSDGNPKDSTNTWIVTYTDIAGSKTNWYKVRFYDDIQSLWSEFSAPITAQELISLCTVDDVKKNIKTVGRFSDDEIFEAIQEIDEEIYEEMGTPINNILTCVGKINNVLQDTYYVGELNIYRIDRVFYGTTTKTELFLDDGYKSNLSYGMIRALPVASNGPTLNDQCDFEISYVPKIMHRYSLYKACEYLLEQVDYVNRGTVSRELETIRTKLARVVQRLQYQNGFGVSSQFENYSTKYPNQNRIRQNFDKNKYIAQYGW